MPTPAQNKVRYGLKNVHYALITENNGTITYGTPEALLGAISISFSATTARKILAADDSYYWVAESLANYTGDMSIAQIPDEFRADCLGEQTDTSGVKYETNAPVTARFALLFEFDGDDHKTRHVLYNCTASKPAIAGQTVNPDDGPYPSTGTETITITAASRPDTLVKARCKPSDTVTVNNTETNIYDTWFISVFVPTLAA
ncbi:MAG: phage tail protein [Oscillospiraceae bacterium]|nr:phage tail protein [Oscillospiraceae bacterium]